MSAAENYQDHVSEIVTTDEEVLSIVEQKLIEYLDEDEAEFIIDEIRSKLSTLLLKKQSENAH